MVTAEDCEGYARDYVWYGQQTDDPVLRNRLFNMALNWRAAAIAMDKRPSWPEFVSRAAFSAPPSQFDLLSRPT